MLYDIGITTIGTLFGQALNFFQEVLFASYFGTTNKADSYILALTIPTIIANEIIGGINGVFIPVYISYKEKYGEFKAKEVFITSLKAISLLTFTIMILGIILSPFITGIITGKFSEIAKVLTGNLMIVLFALIVLMPLSTLFSNFLNANNNFLIPAFGKAAIYGAMIISMSLFAKSISIYSIVLGIIAGNIIFLLLQIISIKRFFKMDCTEYHTKLDQGSISFISKKLFASFQHPAIKEMSILLFPLLFASISNQVNIIVERSIAARFVEGSLASLNYAIKLTIFPVNLIFTSLMTVLFPTLSKYITTGNSREISNTIKKSLKYLFFILIPFVIILILFREQIVRIVFERGAFTNLSTKSTATALGFYAPGIIGLAGIIILSRVYFAFKDTRMLTIIGISIIFFNIFSIILLSSIFGFVGIPLAFSIVSNIHMFILYIFVRKRINI